MVNELTLKERRKLRRQDKNTKIQWIEHKQKRGNVIGIVLGVIVLAGAILGLITLSGQKANELMGESAAIQGQEHIAAGASHAAYNSNPPTSGWHYVQPAQWGVYQTELPDEQLIHNLEHGGVWISYTGISSTTQVALEAIVRSQQKVVLAPRGKNDAPIVLASWGRLLQLSEYDEKTVSSFIKANRYHSPEPFAQ